MIARHIPRSLLPLDAEYIAEDGRVYYVVIEWRSVALNSAYIRLEDGSTATVSCRWLRSVGDTARLHKRLDTRKRCSQCDALLTEDNAPARVVEQGGRCRTCASERAAELLARREVAA